LIDFTNSGNKPIIEIVGRKLLESFPEIKKARQSFNFDFDPNEVSDDFIINFINTRFQLHLSIK
jgi:hypothetical protein